MNKIEIILFIVSILLISSISFFNNETPISIIYAVCGIVYTIFAGKGQIFCYFFGIVATCCYVYLSFINHIYGNCFLNLFYYLPMQILGIFLWKKHLKKGKNEIIKNKLDNKNRVFFIVLSGILCVFLVSVLNSCNDNSSVLDGITTILSIIGMYFTVRRLVEQWLIWIIVDGLAIIMWFKVSFISTNTYSTIVVWSVYLLLGIYFFVKWLEEIKIDK